jgi:AcrR family transcriptional regulator/DNA-binding MarR family transcriptional regulator
MPGRRARGSDGYAVDLPRGRMLSATFALVGERGYGGVSARSVCERAGVSSRAFYECFSDREDCFLAAFNDAVDGLAFGVRGGWESELGWTARVRAGLAALLVALDRERVVRRLVFVEALGAGPRVLARRASVLESLAGVVDQGRVNARAPGMLPALVAEGVVGGAFGVIHARLLGLRPGPLVGLLGGLMATIVLPYRGPGAAARELAHPTPSGRRGLSRSSLKGPAHPAWRATHASDRGRRDAPPIVALDYRLSARTQMALAAVAGCPGVNNNEVSEIIGLADKSQISRMMKRLQGQGLVENAQAHSRRQVKAWRLTADGEALIDAHHSLKRAQRTAGKGGKLLAPRSAAGRRSQSKNATAETAVASTALRMTALTHEVLATVAERTTVAERSRYAGNPSNREIAQAVGVKDEGQISKLLRRLQDHGLLENTRGAAPAAANAWRLTARGEELLSASRPATPGAVNDPSFQSSRSNLAAPAPTGDAAQDKQSHDPQEGE